MRSDMEIELSRRFLEQLHNDDYMIIQRAS